MVHIMIYLQTLNVFVNVVSSAYKIKLRRLLTTCISFTYTTNNKGPNIEPGGKHVCMHFVAEATPSYQYIGCGQKGNF